MCGVFGYLGKRDSAQKIVTGLKRLEYRGYDSWGIAILKNHNIKYFKKTGEIGKVDKIKLPTESNIGIGHTRWATHGGVTETNAHPHLSTDEKFAVAQNGIVENFSKLKEKLKKKGYPFYSQTDTEVIVRLIEEYLKEHNDLLEATRLAFLSLEGRNTILVLDSVNNRIIGIRNGSPMVVGIKQESNKKYKEFYLASDTLSFADKTDRIVQFKDFEMVEIDSDKVTKFDTYTGQEIDYEIEEVDFEDAKIDTDGHPHFMIKEILEQEHTVKEAVQYSKEEMKPLADKVKKAEKVFTVGSGTAAFVAGQIAYFLREYADVDARELKAYETESYRKVFTPESIIIAVSQSGETADTIEALEFAKKGGAKIASIVNMQGSTITRMSDFSYLSRSGPEICVASTKAVTSQMSWGLLLAYTIAGRQSEIKPLIENLSKQMAEFFEEEKLSNIQKLANELVGKHHFFVLGKGQNYFVALEGALKVKEISYKHFEGFAAGELKHGVIALVEDGTPVFAVVSEDRNKEDMISAAHEVKARRAFTIGIARQNNDAFSEVIKMPDGGVCDPMLNVLPFQLLSYYMGVELGYNPDKPRNLAKSVTVK